MDTSRVRTVGLLLGTLLLSACGSTVPVSQQQQSALPGTVAGSEALGQAAPADGVLPLDGAGTAAGAPVGGSTGSGTATDGGLVTGGGTTGTTSGGSTAGDGPTAAGPAGTTSGTGALPASGARRAPAAAGAGLTSPVSIGFIVPPGDGNQANDSAGVETGQSFSLGTVYRGLIAQLNAEGGLAGRKIAPVFHESSAAAADYNAEYAAACATFVQDNKTVAVLTAIGYDPAFTGCLRQGGAFLVDGAAGGADEARMRKETNFLSTGAPTLERRERAVVATGQELGSLPRGTVVGVLVDSCPETRVGYERGLKPAAQKAGLRLVPVEVQCATGFSDLGAISAQLQNAVLRFRSSGVTQVTFVSNTESTGVLLFAQSAESQGYRPGYVLSSRAQPIALEQNLPEEQLKGMVGAGWSPPLDVAFDKQPPRTAPQTRCLGLLRKAGILPKSGADLYFSYTACDALFAYEALLRQTGGRTGLAEVAAAGGRLGTSLQLPGTYATSLSPGALDAPSVRRAFGYDTGCGCFVFRGPQKPLR